MWYAHWFDRRGRIVASYQRTRLSTLVVLGNRLLGNSAIYTRVW